MRTAASPRVSGLAAGLVHGAEGQAGKTTTYR